MDSLGLCQAAGFSQRMLTRYWDTIETDKQIIPLDANGHTNATSSSS